MNTTFFNQVHLANMMGIKKKKEVEVINEELKEIASSNISEIVGIWDKTKAKLIENWISNIEQLKQMSKEDIEKIITNPISRKQIFDFLKL